MVKIYVDTNVYRDLLEGRSNKFNCLSDFAVFTFNQVRDGKYQLVVSDWVVDEFKKYCDENMINNFLNGFKEGQVVKVIRTKEDEQKARQLSPRNYPDALHLVLALKGKCLYLITRNTKDFAEFQNFIEVLLPESL
ncbi:PIN domain-containing protein [Candidatus Woesearchaeota archaeon]|nr:PIN domain-containing protein [Candidatus Woesearchaeota archaeon]